MAKTKPSAPKYKPDPPTMRLEGQHAKSLIDKGLPSGGKVRMTIEARASRIVNESKTPEWGPQHAVHMEITKMEPAGQAKAPTKPSSPAKPVPFKAVAKAAVPAKSQPSKSAAPAKPAAKPAPAKPAPKGRK